MKDCCLCGHSVDDATRLAGVGWVCTSRVACHMRTRAERDEAEKKLAAARTDLKHARRRNRQRTT